MLRRCQPVRNADRLKLTPELKVFIQLPNIPARHCWADNTRYVDGTVCLDSRATRASDCCQAKGWNIQSWLDLLRSCLADFEDNHQTVPHIQWLDLACQDHRQAQGRIANTSRRFERGTKPMENTEAWQRLRVQLVHAGKKTEVY